MIVIVKNENIFTQILRVDHAGESADIALDTIFNFTENNFIADLQISYRSIY